MNHSVKSTTYPSELKPLVIYIIMLTHNRLDKIAKFQFMTSDFVQFVFFHHGKHQELACLHHLMDVGTIDLLKYNLF